MLSPRQEESARYTVYGIRHGIATCNDDYTKQQYEGHEQYEERNVECIHSDCDD